MQGHEVTHTQGSNLLGQQHHHAHSRNSLPRRLVLPVIRCVLRMHWAAVAASSVVAGNSGVPNLFIKPVDGKVAYSRAETDVCSTARRAAGHSIGPRAIRPGQLT